MHSQKSASATDVVTKIDFEIEEYLAKEFSKIDTTVAFVGEEYGGDRSAAKQWLVDPIDGTAHFVRGLPFCTTMVALIENGQVIFSAIYDFVNDIMYHAERGKGAYKNGEAIRVSDRPFGSSYMFYESNLNKGDNLNTYLKFKKKTMVLNTLNAGYEFSLIASGKIEGRVCLDPFGKDYDFAPGSVGDGPEISAEQLTELEMKLQEFSQKRKSIVTNMTGFGGIDNWKGAVEGKITPYVIWLNVEVSPELMGLWTELRDAITVHYPTWLPRSQIYVPHVTLVFADLTKEGYEKGMQYLADEQFQSPLTISHVALVECYGEGNMTSREYKRFNFGAQDILEA